MTTSIKGRERTTATNDSTFGLRCTGGPVPRHAYRLEARGYAVATDGFRVGGALQYGKSATYTCL
ncbi:hypothetical protein ACIQU5_36260 [Streptomyces sp. NPDC090306]|uniref:hypothetical protein n=1 Tax=Streptomyces sp. NPDC090306 TaxID=3365961 RepID=UPI003812143B